MDNEKSSWRRFSSWLRDSLAVKLLSIGLIILLLLIPVYMVQDLIRERAYLRESAVQEVSAKWGAQQVVTGPVLTIPYLEQVEEADGKMRTVRRRLNVLPADLRVSGSMEEEVRRRGIYEVVLYTSRLSLSGTFEYPDLAALAIGEPAVLWDQARLAVGIADMVGIAEEIFLGWEGTHIRMQPGTDNQGLLPTGVSAALPRLAPVGEPLQFSLDLSLKGSEYLGITPVGRRTEVELRSGWPSPSFAGSFLPEQRAVSPDGFSATWRVLDLNRNFPQQWTDLQYQFGGSDFGVRLLQAVDTYGKNTRTAKYALFVIGLTFLVYFFFEILKRFRIHPFQYLLVGLALSMFYLLTLSISEHLGFDAAYVLAAAATIGLISGYSAVVLRYRELVIQLAALLVLIYGFIFVVLQLEDLALLVGSVGLFIALAVVMYLSRKVNWYGEEETNDGK